MGIINDSPSRMKTLAGSGKVGAPIKLQDPSNTRWQRKKKEKGVMESETNRLARWSKKFDYWRSWGEWQANPFSSIERNKRIPALH